MDLHEPAADLLSRRLVAAGLARALAPPRAFPVLPLSADQFCSAWNLFAAQAAASAGKRWPPDPLRPDRVDVRAVWRYLQLPAIRRERACNAVFGLVVSQDCPPFETEYLPSRDAFQRAQELADIAGFYQAFGLQPAPRRGLRPDHVALELEFVAFLLEKIRMICSPAVPAGGRRRRSRAASTPDRPAAETATRGEHEKICRDALRSFMTDHVAWWIPAFTCALEKRISGLLPHARDRAQRAALRGLEQVSRALRAWITGETMLQGIPAALRPACPAGPHPAPDDGPCGGGECPAACTLGESDRL